MFAALHRNCQTRVTFYSLAGQKRMSMKGKQLIAYAGAPGGCVIRFPSNSERRPRAKRLNDARRADRLPKIGFARILFDSNEVLCGLLDLTAQGAKLTSRFAEEFPEHFSVTIGRKTEGDTKR